MTGLSHIKRHIQITDTCSDFHPNLFKVQEVGEGGRPVCQNCVKGTENNFFCTFWNLIAWFMVSLAKLLVDLLLYSWNVPTPHFWKEWWAFSASDTLNSTLSKSATFVLFPSLLYAGSHSAGQILSCFKNLNIRLWSQRLKARPFYSS